MSDRLVKQKRGHCHWGLTIYKGKKKETVGDEWTCSHLILITPTKTGWAEDATSSDWGEWFLVSSSREETCILSPQTPLIPSTV